MAAVAVEDIGGAVQLGPGEDDVGGEPPSATLAATSCSSQARWASVKDAATSLSLSDMVVGSSLLDPRECTGTGMLLAFLLQLRLNRVGTATCACVTSARSIRLS